MRWDWLRGSRMRRHKKLLVIATLLLGVYVASYLWLSRRGYAEADQYNITGFYYFFPEDSDAWRFKNYGCWRWRFVLPARTSQPAHHHGSGCPRWKKPPVGPSP